MRILLRAAMAAILALALYPPGASAAEGDLPAETERILRAEDARIRAMVRLIARPDERAATAPGASPRLSQPCGTTGKRVVEVGAAAALHTALAAAQPGDLIVLADGVYSGEFVAARSGTAEAPIALCGARAAVLDAGAREGSYGFHLKASHWVLAGFTVRHASKGVVADGAQHAIIRGLEIAQIGDEGLHLRSFSSDNRVEHNWIHDTGLRNAPIGEGIYIGSAHSNWPNYSGGQPDTSDRNEVVGNLIGPNVTAEHIDIKEGTSDGLISQNVFLGIGLSDADSWIDLKGNSYTIADNQGGHVAGTSFKEALQEHTAAPGWGRRNRIGDTRAVRLSSAAKSTPFRASTGPAQSTTLVLPSRELPYTLSELRARFADSFERIDATALLLKEHILAGPRARLSLTQADAAELRLLSGPARFVSLVGYHGEVRIAGDAQQRIVVRSWDAAAQAADALLGDGRAFVIAYGGRMDINQAEFYDLGFGTGRTSGVGWKGFADDRSRGDVLNSRFERNLFGAYTFEAEGMHWINNVFANNISYGFDPHDFSNNFLVEGNQAFGNGTHGIIFSRGCSGNIIRRNSSYQNAVNGIMIDDGKVADDGDPRHAAAVPSNDNIIEANEVWGNQVGIVLEGGTRNIVRANLLSGNQFGIRLKNAASGNTVRENTIGSSTDLAIQIYGRSIQNRIANNRIIGGQGGILIQHSAGNTIEHNQISAIVGRGMAFTGNVADMVVANNVLGGRGTAPIDLTEARGVSIEQLVNNQTSAWDLTGPPTRNERIMMFIEHHPAIVLWVIILLIPLGMRLLLRRRAPA